MKKVHVLPTDKPSRLIKNNRGYALITDKFTQSDLDFIQAKFINIYITSDEEKKEERCWVINSMDKIESVPHSKWGKLIIMTTNQDLIKDGIQAIPDEFLEWFVKNPSCEMVEVENNWIGWTIHTYKIIIPKDELERGITITHVGKQEKLHNLIKERLNRNEEPKQDWYCPKCQSYVSSESVTFDETHQICNTSVIIQEPKQEILEETAERLYPIILEDDGWDKNKQYRDEWIEGVKWQQERSYGKEEVLEMMRITRRNEDWTVSQLFEQFKKKYDEKHPRNTNR